MLAQWKVVSGRWIYGVKLKKPAVEIPQWFFWKKLGQGQVRKKNTEKLQILEMGVNHLKQPEILILKKMRIEDTYVYPPWNLT